MNPMTQYPPRPTLTDDLLKSVVNEFLLEHPDFTAKLGSNGADDIVSEYSLGTDGFELCKRLEKYCSWDTDREDMDVLDELDCCARQMLKEAEQNWITQNNIQPPYANGTRVKVTSGPRGIGTIDTVCDHSPGCFLLAPANPSEFDRSHNTRWVVRFEHVQPADEAGS